MMASSDKIDWTEEQISTLLSMCPTASPTQIANTLHRSRSSIVNKAVWLHRKGLLEKKWVQPSKAKKWRSKSPLKPDKQDFDAVKLDYCRQHQLTVPELSARFEQDDQLLGELYRLAQAAKRTRLPG